MINYDRFFIIYKAILQLNNNNKTNNPLKRFEQTFYQRRYVNSKYTHENILSIISY